MGCEKRKFMISYGFGSVRFESADGECVFFENRRPEREMCGPSLCKKRLMGLSARRAKDTEQSIHGACRVGDGEYLNLATLWLWLFSIDCLSSSENKIGYECFCCLGAEKETKSYDDWKKERRRCMCGE
ncbi:hypothetical protein HBI81_109810 [Parastagonospora nodorum]|nr:hypothetical protein HBI10_168560 [Parastagonospora nodorum]KAH4015758.1 hypothetical protein HBI13_158150 [Parastagonospora nodorum]KAH4125304.1 hypothetical protein HBH47_061170 [Parastagonospora nodorum]KAH4985021.1 hypothetical protein HBI76_132090 [Parastagonospora nodorum]KAH5087648.1 hypothetical protein HBI73_143900 [Parastagonospora nodorum]